VFNLGSIDLVEMSIVSNSNFGFPKIVFSYIFILLWNGIGKMTKLIKFKYLNFIYFLFKYPMK